MNNVVSWISFGLWVIYGLLFIYREIIRNRKSKKNNIFHMLRFDTILFLGIYLFYQYFADNFKFVYLYLAIIITNIVYILYDLADNYELKKNRNNLNYYILFLFVAIGLGIYYFYSNNYILLTTVTLIIDIFIPLYVWLLNIVNKKKNN